MTAADCTVHLADITTGAERQHRCGTVLERGTFLGWIEQGHSISWPERLVSDEEQREVSLPLVPAATFTIGGVKDLASAPLLQLVHLGDGASLFPREFRSVRQGQRIRVPAARYVAILLDHRGDAISISPPLRLAAAQSLPLEPVRPVTGANLLTVLQLPETTRPLKDDPALLVRRQAPAVTFDAGRERFAIWYGIEPGHAQVDLESKSLALTPIDVRLVERGVHTTRAEARFLPVLAATLTLDTERVTELPKLALSVTAENDDRLLYEGPIAPGETVRAEKLPREIVVAALQVNTWSFSRRVDLTSGEDASLDFDIEPLEIHGTVTRGRKPARAKLTFRQGRHAESVSTDDAGEYELLLWTPGRYEIDVALIGAATTSLNELYRIERSERIDIDVPDTRAAVRIMNTETGQPIERAQVAVRNVWNDTSGRRVTMRSLTTDARGMVDMPPLRDGTIEVHAGAEGFQTVGPLPFDTGAVPAVVEISLKPMGPETAVHIALPDGPPAAGAELMAVANGNTIWMGTAADDGKVMIADAVAGSVVVVRHRGAGTMVRQFAKAPEALRWTMPPAASPLLVKAERGGGPVRQAVVTLWVDGVPLTGEALAFAARSGIYTDGAGLWIGSNLPQAPVRVLLTTGTAPRSPRADEALAATIVFPWPATNVIAPIN